MEYRSYFRDSVYPSLRDPFFPEHLARYRFAMNWVPNRRVLEIGCGKGYGSWLLAQEAKEVIAIDLNKESLQFARTNYQRANLQFVEHQLTQSSEKTLGSFDVIVLFEVIEHIPAKDVDELLKNIKSLLRENGELLISTPNHEVVTKSGMPVPEFHINNLNANELKSELSRYFQKIEMYGQIRRKSPLYLMALYFDRWSLRHQFRHSPASAAAVSEEDYSYLNDHPWNLDSGWGASENFLFTKRIVKQAGMLFAVAGD